MDIIQPLIEYVEKYNDVYKYVGVVRDVAYYVLGIIILYIAFKYVIEVFKNNNKNYRVAKWSINLSCTMVIVIAITLSINFGLNKILESKFNNTIQTFHSVVDETINSGDLIEAISIQDEFDEEIRDVIDDDIATSNFNVNERELQSVAREAVRNSRMSMEDLP